jgi:peptide deformylase
MPKLKIVRLGHPALRAKSRPVTKAQLADPDYQKFLDELATICVANQGAGIAAPQVGINQRVIVVHVDPANPRYPGKQPFPLTIVVNPRVTSRSRETAEGWEGDLSVGIRGLVPRPVSCAVSGWDRHGNPVHFDLTYDFHARVFQHEIDHLDGKFFIDRVKRHETLSELAEWEKYWKDKPLP